MTIKHTELELGPITLLSRPNAEGWTWVHFAGIDSEAYSIQNVHLSRLRADDGFNEILEQTDTLGMLQAGTEDYLEAVRRAKKLGVIKNLS